MTATVVLPYLSAIWSGIVAIAVGIRAGRSPARWAFVAGMTVLSAECVFTALSLTTKDADGVLRWQTARLFATALLPGPWLLFSMRYARGKNVVFSSLERGALWAALIVPPVLVIVFRLKLLGWAPNPSSQGTSFLAMGAAGVGLFVLLLISSVGILLNLERTFRASVGTMRWRIKFMLLGVGVLFIVRTYTSSQALLFRAADLSLQTVDSITLLLASGLVTRALFRTGHFDLEVYPSQSALQKSLTILLAGVYLVIIGVLAKVMAHFGGDVAFAPKAFLLLLSLVILAVGLQSDRARLYLRRFVSRHFHRPLYDYRVVWIKFTEGSASSFEQAELCRSLARLTADTFDALSVTIWLSNEKQNGFVLADSTSLATGTTSTAAGQEISAPNVLEHFVTHPDPVDFETIEATWAATLRESNPSQFPHGGHRVCIPLIRHGEIVGLLVVGDRVTGTPFSVEDFDMLKCIAEHSTASLMNVRLSRQLLQAKELEAFQTMAAFFVHDLKNAASTLNLMLQNLPIHFDDPAFRQDALRGMGKTVSHINGLISRLSVLRHELKINPVAANIADIVNQAVAGLEIAGAARFVKQLPNLPPVLVDVEQIQKVVTNLALNASEATGRGGEVKIAAAFADDEVVLSVEDNGCGMSAEFVQKSLFRPFQTTKKNGLGIGMFQSKMIIEAHGGKISVVSEPGKGSTFRIHLPVQK